MTCFSRVIVCLGCPACAETVEDYEPEVTLLWAKKRDFKVEIVCPSCGHEVEIGYGDPEGEGKIHPIGGNEFYPQALKPAEQYRDKWEARGWCRQRDRCVGWAGVNMN